MSLGRVTSAERSGRTAVSFVPPLSQPPLLMPLSLPAPQSSVVLASSIWPWATRAVPVGGWGSEPDAGAAGKPIPGTVHTGEWVGEGVWHLWGSGGWPKPDTDPCKAGRVP